ncbi:MAG: AarF/ABC1/UbiB kinase family protein [Atopobiaceae bacterium]|nr:AarF/ABC1/UbiB kinase family protein [Atopobiaceae bacterium]
MNIVTQALATARKRIEEDHSPRRMAEIVRIMRNHKVIEGLSPEKVVAILEDLGPTFVKLGQIASTHTDILPEEYCEALACLRSSVAPMDIETVYEQVEAQLGKPVDELFERFDEAPLGSASVAQVHRARLTSGEEVAVKVQRPGIVETITDDFALLEKVVGMSELVGESTQGVSLKEIVAELEHTSKSELDFTNEASNLEYFLKNNEGREGVHSPRCYRNLCTEAILVEEYVRGPEVGDETFIETLSDTQRDWLGRLIADNFAAQVLVDGFYHADPHAGNVILVEDGICWIDFGMMDSMTSKERQTITDMIVAIVKRDSYALKRCVLQVATPRTVIDHGKLLDMCERIIDEYADSDLESFNTAQLLSELTAMLNENGYDLDPFITNFARALITIEGTVKELAPQVNIMECLSSYVDMNFNIESLSRDARRLALKVLQGADDLAGLPTKTVETMDMLQKGQLKVNGEVGVERHSITTFQAVADGLIRAILAGAVFLGSCMLCLTELEPRILGVPAFGFVGFVLGFILMLQTFFDLRKARRIQRAAHNISQTRSTRKTRVRRETRSPSKNES